MERLESLVAAFHTVTSPFVAVLDADGSYHPSDLEKFLPLLEDYDFVKGERMWDENMSGLHRFGNRVITRTFNVLFGTTLADICSGMYLLRTEKVASMTFEKHPLTLEQELTAADGAFLFQNHERSDSYRKRYGGKSKTSTWRQGFRDLATNFDLATTYNPILLYSFLASIAIIPAFGLMVYALVLNYFFSNYHSGYFLGSAILFIMGFQGLTVATIGAMMRRIERKIGDLGR